mmetsp:Transcript_68388/g.198241  ORF Transcript_68388/g.198241 Transcript_68388/m.198241 type:complete len:387 (+) Transcript_68388:120-1280(+)
MVFSSHASPSGRKRNNSSSKVQHVISLMVVIVTIGIIVTSRRMEVYDCVKDNGMGGSIPIDKSFQISLDRSPQVSVSKKSKLGLARNPGDPLPPGRSSEVTLQQRAYNRLMVVPEYKLLFCYIEKVGCSMFNQLFRLLRIYHPSLTPEERAYLAESHFGRAKAQHFNMTAAEVSKHMTDPEWTKVVFFRDPADRFLSGFKSKCGGADDDGARHCHGAFGHYMGTNNKRQPILGGDPLSFQQAVEMAWNGTHSVFANHHFKMSADFCGGLDTTIDHYNMVHLLDKNTVGMHVKDLFDHLGVEKELSEELLDRVVKTGGALHPVDVEKVQKAYGLKLRGNISKSHNTADHKVSTKEYFGSPEMLKKLQKAYSRDYDMFQLVPPNFDEL